MKGLELLIKENMEELNATEQRIGNYIIKNQLDILRLPIAQLAKNAKTSQAAVVRFCKRIGFEGLKDIKIYLADELAASNSTGRDEESYSDIKVSDSPAEIIEKVCINHILALENTMKTLDISQFKLAVNLLSRAQRIDVFGAGASGLVAQDMQQKFMRIGKFCFSYLDVHMQLTAAASLTKNDAAMFISYSGKTRQVMDCLLAAKDRGTKTIALTKLGQNPLAKQADIALGVCSAEISIRSGATSSRITQLAVVDMLFTNVASQCYEQNQQILQRSRTYSEAGRL